MDGDLKAELKAYAGDLGISALGIAAPQVAPEHAARHIKWLARGYAGEMGYLARKPEARYDAASLLPECRSVVVIALDYYYPRQDWPQPGRAKFSRYAWGEDYHTVLRDRLVQLRDWLNARVDAHRSKLCVDTSPLSEKAFSVAAGLGWAGRNSLVINRQRGSYFFVGLLLSSADLAPDLVADEGCGTCTACLSACPTGALSGPGILDARKCVSYLTTERREPVEAGEALNGWLYGCDTCQQVCPYNATPAESHESRFAPREELISLTAAAAAGMDERRFDQLFAGTAVRRRTVVRLNAQGRALLAQGTV